MSLTKKLFLAEGTQVPCVNLPMDVDLGDVHPWAASLAAAIELVADGKSPAFIYFAESASELKLFKDELKLAYKNKIGFWVAYVNNPAPEPELSRKKLLKRMKKAGLKARAEEVIDRNWSGLYFSKNKVK
ncbi:MAG: hypothetical protein RLZ99_292 [Actinomycetota bacterium]